MKKILITAIILLSGLWAMAQSSDSTYTTYTNENSTGYEGTGTDSSAHEWFSTQTVTVDTIGTDSLLWIKTISTSRQCTKCGRQEVLKDIWNTYLKEDEE